MRCSRQEHRAADAELIPPHAPVMRRLATGINLYKQQQQHYITLHYTHTHTHPFNGRLSGTTRVSRYQRGKTNLDFTEARDSEWQWHQLGHMQVCTSLQTDDHASNPPLIFLQAGCPSCCPTNSVKALKEYYITLHYTKTMSQQMNSGMSLKVREPVKLLTSSTTRSTHSPV